MMTDQGWPGNRENRGYVCVCVVYTQVRGIKALEEMKHSLTKSLSSLEFFSTKLRFTYIFYLA